MLSFLLLIEEKKQKKIKASGTPAKFSWYFKTSGTLVKLVWYQTKFPAPEGAVRNAGQVSGGHQGVPAKFAGYMIEMIVYPAFIFHFSFFTSPLAR